MARVGHKFLCALFFVASRAVTLTNWQVLGPFPLGKTELDALPQAPAPSELVTGGEVRGWLRLRSDSDGSFTYSPAVDWSTLVQNLGDTLGA